MAYEDVLQNVGGYGKFQEIFKYLFVVPITMMIPWYWMNLIFMVSVPDHWCNVPMVKDHNMSTETWRSIISPPDNPSCEMYDMDFRNQSDKVNVTYSNDTKVIACKYGWQYDDVNYYATVATKWDLVCDRSHYPSLILTLQKLGNLIGTPLFGFLSDKIGRKVVMLMIGIIVCAGEAVSLMVDNLYVFMVLKIITGSVLCTAITLVYIFCVELVPPEKRTYMTFIINCAWSLGLCAIPLFAYTSKHWIGLGIVNVVSGAFILSFWKFLPESPCWLVSQGRYEEATAIMKRIGDTNGKVTDESALFKQLQALGEHMKRQKKEESHSNFNLFKYPRLRKHFILLTISWIASNIGYYGFIHNAKNLTGNEFLNFFLISVSEFPANIVFTQLMERCGRRWTNSIGLFFTGIICLAPITGIPYIDVISSVVGKFSANGTLLVTDQQGSEIFPTVTRTFAIGAAKIFSIGATLLLPYLADLTVYGGILPFLVLSFVSIVASVMVSFLPETLNENLPQTITEAEEFGEDQKYFSWKRKMNTSVTLTPEYNMSGHFHQDNGLLHM